MYKLIYLYWYFLDEWYFSQIDYYGNVTLNIGFIQSQLKYTLFMKYKYRSQNE